MSDDPPIIKSGQSIPLDQHLEMKADLLRRIKEIEASIEDLRRKIAELDAKSPVLDNTSMLTNEEQGFLDRFNSEIAEITTSVGKLRTELQDLNEKSNTARNDLIELETELRQIFGITEGEQVTEKLLNVSDDSQTMIERLENEIKARRTELEQAENEIKETQEKIEDLRKTDNILKQLRGDTEGVDPRIDKSREWLSTARKLWKAALEGYERGDLQTFFRAGYNSFLLAVNAHYAALTDYPLDNLSDIKLEEKLEVLSAKGSSVHSSEAMESIGKITDRMNKGGQVVPQAEFVNTALNELSKNANALSLKE